METRRNDEAALNSKSACKLKRRDIEEGWGLFKPIYSNSDRGGEFIQFLLHKCVTANSRSSIGLDKYQILRE